MKREFNLDVSKIPLQALNNICVTYGLELDVRTMTVKIFEVEYV